MNFAATSRSRHLSERFRSRLVIGVVLSLLIHGLLLSLQFGMPGLGLPGLDLPWNQRRAQAPQLSVLLANVEPRASAAADTSAHEVQAVPVMPKAKPVSKPVIPLPPPVVPVPPAPDSSALKLVAPVPPAEPEPTAQTPAVQVRRESPRPKFHPRIITRKKPDLETVAVPPPNLDAPEQATPPVVETPSVADAAVEPPVAEVPPVPAVVDTPAPVEAERIAAEKQAQKDQELAAAKQEEQNAKRRAAEAEAARKQADDVAQQQAAALAQQQAQQQALAKQKEAEAARQMKEAETSKQEQAARMQLAMELEARKQKEEAARSAAALALQKQAAQKLEEQETARRAEALELKKQEEAKAERRAAELQAQQQAEEIARQKARIEQKIAAELAALEKAQGLARKEADAAKAKAQDDANKSRQAANTPAAGAGASASASANASSREPGATGSALTLPGRPLASRALEQIRKNDLFRNELPLARPLPGAMDSPGRRSIFGSIATDVSVTMYVESWRLKIERNGSFNYSQSSKDRARGDPVVTVIVRSDGSVEDVIIHHGSGRPEIDEAVRRIIRLNTPYAAFPPDLARKYDVIEIRRIWSFDDRLRILEEVR